MTFCQCGPNTLDKNSLYKITMFVVSQGDGLRHTQNTYYRIYTSIYATFTYIGV